MKYTIICFLLLDSLFCLGQSKTKTKELGPFVEANGSYSNVDSRAFGLQFKISKKNNKAFRIQALYKANTRLNEPFEYAIVKDTVKTKQVKTENRSFYVGFGVEQQHKLYSKCFMYASLDARIGYGYGYLYQISNSKVIDTVNQFYYSNAFKNYSTKEKISGVNSNWFGLDILPSVGSKIILPHLVFGIETGLNLSNNYLSQHGNQIRNYSIYDLNLSYLNYRAYINFRF
jgi:hypothetical protein